MTPEVHEDQPFPQELPLYLADHKALRIQQLDAATVAHLWDIAHPQPVQIQEIEPQFTAIPWGEVSAYVPSEEWFASPEYVISIHGHSTHMRRVVIAGVLSRVNGLSEHETALAMAASGVNDIRRLDDRTDEEHAARSAQWFIDHQRLYARRGITFSEDDIRIVTTLIKHHEQPYESYPEDLLREHEMLVKVHKNTLALDRFRLHKPKWWPREEYLELASSVRLMPFMQYLVLKTEADRLIRGIPYELSLRNVGSAVGIIEAPENHTSDVFISEPETDRGYMTIKDKLLQLNRQKYGVVPVSSMDASYPLNIPADIPVLGVSMDAGQAAIRAKLENDPDLAGIDLEEAAWNQALETRTPNGYLYRANSLFAEIGRGEPFTLTHVTPSLHTIRSSGILYPSGGGCLGASVYCVPLGPDGQLHNLTRFISEVQMPGNGVSPDILLFEFTPPYGSPERAVQGVDYLKFGQLQADAFRAAMQGDAQEILAEVARIMHDQLVPASEFLIMCQNPSDVAGTDMGVFEAAFQQAFSSFPVLGYPYFETLSEYISLYQNDEHTKRLAERGEHNVWNYHELAFGLRPGFRTKFRLQTFNPTIEEISEAIRGMASDGKGILDFSEEHFREFMKARVAVQVRKLMGMDPQVFEHPFLTSGIVSTTRFEDFLNSYPDLAGHVIHRALRLKNDWLPVLHDYETVRARLFWDYLKENGIMFFTNAIIPKGEVGFHPYNHPGFQVSRATLHPDGSVHREEHLELRVVDSLLPMGKSVLRHRGDEGK